MKMTPPFQRSPGNYDPIAACEECCVKTWEPSMTQQSQAEEADINTIVKRFGLTGQLPTDLRTPTYADFDEVYDYKTAMDAVAQANSSFMKMPPQLRAQFNNNPQEFLEYVEDPKNIDALRDMGLANPKKQESSTTRPTGVQPPPEPAQGDPRVDKATT